MQEESFSIGDRVQITKEGAIAHKQHHDDQVNVAANVPVPLAGVGADKVKELVFTFPKSGWRGTIVEEKGRWWGQSGSDYLVKWDNNSGQSWHLIEHLILIE